MLGRGYIQDFGFDPTAWSPKLYDAVVTNSAELVAAITDPTINTIFIRDGAYSLAAFYDLGAAANNVTMMRGETEAGVVIDMNGFYFTNTTNLPIYIMDMTILDGYFRNIGERNITQGPYGGLYNVTVDHQGATFTWGFRECCNLFNCKVLDADSCDCFDTCNGLHNCVVDTGEDATAFDLCGDAVNSLVMNITNTGAAAAHIFNNCSNFANTVMWNCNIGSNAFWSCENFTNINMSQVIKNTGAADGVFEDCTLMSNIAFATCVFTDCAVFEDCEAIDNVYFYGSNTMIAPAVMGLFARSDNLTNIYWQENAGGSNDKVDGAVFRVCTNISDVIVSVENSGATEPTNAFEECTGISNVRIVRFTSTNPTTGFDTCTDLVNCICETADLYTPFDSCDRLTQCKMTALPNAAGNQRDFISCTYLENCWCLGHGANLIAGFYLCDHLVFCVVTTGAATACFHLCTNILEATAGGAVAFLSCSFLGGDWHEETDVATPVTCYSGNSYNNQGAVGAVVYNLPAAAANLRVRFICDVAQDMVITAAAGDDIQVQDETSSVAGTATIDDIGASITLRAIDGTTWYAHAAVGAVVVA